MRAEASHPSSDGRGDGDAPPHNTRLRASTAADGAETNPRGKASADQEALAFRLEWALALAMTALIAILHLVRFFQAGALWRDEVNGVNLASLPLGEIGRNLQFDSFPLLWFGLLRLWIVSGAGMTDQGLRLLGLLIGLGILGALWRNGRAFGPFVPLFSLAFLGANAAVLVYGDSLRGYGLGMLTGLTAFGLVREAARRPTRARALAATMAGLVSVHCLYQNAILLFAACAGGVAVALDRREGRTVALFFLVGIPSALSLLLYRGVVEAMESFVVILRSPVDLTWLGKKFFEAMEGTGPLAPWLWFGAAALAAGTALRGRGLPEKAREAAFFGGTALAVGTGAYIIFLLRLSFPMQPWYFFALFALGAASLDTVFMALPLAGRLRLLRAAAAALVFALALPGLSTTAQLRMTNLDLAAEAIDARAGGGDLVVVTPWMHGISFDRYYRGKAAWETVPPLPVHKLHRYDQLKVAMMSSGAMAPLLEKIEAALRAGRRVFWVGSIDVPPRGKPAPRLPPAPQGLWGWRETPHYQLWGQQAGAIFRDHARRWEPLPVKVEAPVSKYERLPVTVFEGWRDTRSGPSP